MAFGHCRSVFYVLWCAMALVSPSVNADTSGIAVMLAADTASPSPIPRSSDIFRKAYAAISDLLHAEGFDVYGISIIDDETVRSGVYDDVKILEAVRLIEETKIHVIVLISVHARPLHLSHQTKADIMVGAQMYHVSTRQQLGNVKLGGSKDWVLPDECSKRCFVATAGKFIEIVSSDVAAFLVQKMEYLQPEAEDN